MKTKMRVKFGYIAVVAFVLALASCGHSTKSKQVEKMNQPQDSAVIIEEETVIVAVDSIAPDSTVKK